MIERSIENWIGSEYRYERDSPIVYPKPYLNPAINIHDNEPFVL